MDRRELAGLNLWFADLEFKQPATDGTPVGLGQPWQFLNDLGRAHSGTVVGPLNARNPAFPRRDRRFLPWSLSPRRPLIMILARVDRLAREAYDFSMTVAQIIEEIGALPPEDQCRIVQFAYRLDAERRLTGRELSALAGRMVGCVDPAEALRLREQIVRGFYGSDPDA